MLKTVFGIALLFSSIANAASLENLIQAANDKQLGHHAQWIAIGHYSGFNKKKGTANSYVDDKAFFLHPDGKNNPPLELIATLQALAQPTPKIDKERDQHPRCRFIYRYKWLGQQLDTDFEQQFGNISCPAYTKWKKMVNAYKVSLIYPAAHLNSPSSMYGHTLLRLDPKEENSDWLSWAVNFGANIPEGDNSITFAYKGIAGGYPGLFNVMPYFEKIQEYGRMEDRDLWEYQLNLNPMETNRLVEHLWELKNINFAYFFFDENCSYRLLELLEVARPSIELTDDFPLFAIPIDTVRTIYKTGLIEEKHYRPSISTQLHAQAALLNDHESELALSLIESANALNSTGYTALSSDRKGLVAQTAYRFLRQRNKKSQRSKAIAQHSFALLQAMNKNPAKEQIDIAKPTAPEYAHDSSMWGLAWGAESNQKFADLELRLSFHNLTDRHQGFLPGASIDMGKLVVRKYEDDDLQLQELNLVEIHSSTPRDKFFKPLSWKVKFGAERRLMSNKNVLATHVTGGAGVSYKWGGVLAYAMGLGRIEANSRFSSNIDFAGVANLGAVHYADFGNTQLDYNYTDFTSAYDRSELILRQSITLSKNAALRFDFAYNDNSDIRYKEYSVNFRRHF